MKSPYLFLEENAYIEMLIKFLADSPHHEKNQQLL